MVGHAGSPTLTVYVDVTLTRCKVNCESRYVTWSVANQLHGLHLLCALFRDTVGEDDDDVRVLRERRPNATNRSELLQLMHSTREERRLWINSTSPSITEILNIYPRFQDIDTAVSMHCHM